MRLAIGSGAIRLRCVTVQKAENFFKEGAHLVLVRLTAGELEQFRKAIMRRETGWIANHLLSRMLEYLGVVSLHVFKERINPTKVVI